MQRSAFMNWFSVLAKNDWRTTFILWNSNAALPHYLPTLRRYLHNGDFNIHPLVKEAMESRKPVVALESTIITHGMPYPQNLSMAREVEEIVRENGCVPATIGILNGCIHVGFQDEELEILATAKDVMKVSRRDFPYVLSQGI
ncbi:hypothetical protein NXF25_013073 [Crotalus adamanteus]|uniref:Pseudouridine-5'-phosphate glycosidase n=1 Tax=Crotalus adamanteus TaxID=8729 RepID=A0AAW1BDI2_CROAD